MSRVLIAGGAGALGAAIARRLLSDPAYDARIADDRAAPLWMREGCEIRDGDLRVPAHALAATRGCALVVHAASYAPGDADAADAPHSLIEHENAVHAALVRAAVERRVERFVYVSSADVLAGAAQLPTPEAALVNCRAPRSPRAFARLSGERYCTAAHAQHGLPYAILRPSALYGASGTVTAGAGEPGVEPLIAALVHAALDGERTFALDRAAASTLTPTHLDDVADAIVLALEADAVDDDFNIAGERELTLSGLAAIASDAAGAGAGGLTLKAAARDGEAPPRSVPSAQKARELLGWHAQIAVDDGLVELAGALRASGRAVGAAL